MKPFYINLKNKLPLEYKGYQLGRPGNDNRILYQCLRRLDSMKQYGIYEENDQIRFIKTAQETAQRLSKSFIRGENNVFLGKPNIPEERKGHNKRTLMLNV